MCVCVSQKGKAFSVLSVGGAFFEIFKYLLLNIISIYKMHVTILYTVINFLQTQKSRTTWCCGADPPPTNPLISTLPEGFIKNAAVCLNREDTCMLVARTRLCS